MARAILPVAQRFWAKVQKGDGCWVWTAPVNSSGYGYFRVDIERPYVLAHRFAYELTFGPVPDGLFVCHQCDNPPCVRPDHLFAGTNADNMRDAFRKGRLKVPDGSAGRKPRARCLHGHALTPENVITWRDHSRNRDVRRCRTCANKRDLAGRIIRGIHRKRGSPHQLAGR